MARLTQPPSPEGRSSAAKVGSEKALQLGCLLGLLLLSAGSFVYFHTLSVLILIPLAALTYRRPVYGASALFLVISVDTAEPVLDSIFVSFSEFELAACLLGWRARGQVGRFDRQLLSWAAPFLGVVLVSGILSTEWYKVLPHVLRVSELFVMAAIAACIFRRSKDREGIRWVLVIAILFYCVAGLLQIHSAHRGRIASFFENANQFAGYLNLILPYLLTCFFSLADQRLRPLWGYLVGGTLMTELAILSRSALVAAGVSGGLIWALFYFRRLGSVLHSPWSTLAGFGRRSGPAILSHLVLLVGLALVLVFFTSLPEVVLRSVENVMGRSRGGAVASVVDFRLPYFRLGKAVWKDHFLLGVGPGRYQEAVNDYSGVLEEHKGKVRDYEIVEEKIRIHTHNLYLQLGVEYGLLGLLAFLYFLGRVGFRLMLHHGRSPWALGGVGLLVAFVIHNCFDVTFPSLALEMGFLLGISLAETSERRPVSEHHPCAGRPR